MTIRPSVALVTGGNRGLGLETCRQLARQGHRVILTSRAGESAERAAAPLQAEGLDVLPQALDVASGESIRRAYTDVMRVAGRVDILINNAAILRGDGQSVFDSDLETFREVLETNVLGALEVSRAFAPAMAERGFGRIVNVSSGAGQLATMTTYAPAYSLSKAALNALTRLMAGALQGRGVLVNSVDPGWVRTDMGGPRAPRSLAQGVDTIVWLATLADDGPSGGFFHDRERIPW